MPSKEVAPVTPAVPELAPTPASTLTAEDIAISTLYVGHGSSRIVAEGLAKAGDLYAAQNADDNDPIVLLERGNTEGLLFVPLHMFKTWGFSEGAGSPFQIWRFDDPERDPRAKLTYNYLILVPEYDTELPLKLRLTGTSTPAAQKMNMPVLRTGQPFHDFAYRMTTVKREKPGVAPWYVVQLQPAEQTAEQAEQAHALVELTAPIVNRMASRGVNDANAPAI